MATKYCYGARDFLIAPFVIGNQMVYPNRTGKSDGKISSTVFMACVIPIIFVVIIFTSIEPSIRKPSPASWGIAEITVTVGLFFSVFLTIAAFRAKSKWISGIKSRDFSQRPRLAFLWLFGFVVILYATLEMSINIDCVSKHSSEPFPGEQILSVFSHLVEILFFASQLGFIAYFVNVQFLTSVVLNYGISIMLMTHLVFWFQTNINSLFRHGILKHENFTSRNASDCFWSSDLNTLRKKIEPYVSPARTEYSLLAAAFLLKMWCLSDEEIDEKHDDDPTTQTDERTPLLRNCEESLNTSTNQSCRPVNFSRGATTLHVPTDTDREDDDEMREYSRLDDIAQFSRSTQRHYPISFYVIIFIGIALVCPVMVGALIMITVRRKHTEMMFVWQVMVFIFSSLHFLFTAFTFALSKNQCVRIKALRKLNSKGNILTLSAAGTIAHSTFVILSVAWNEGSSYFGRQTVIVTIFGEVINIIGVYIQTVLIIYAEQCVRRPRIDFKVGVASLYFLLLITNLASWCSHSFIDYEIKGIRKYKYLCTSYNICYWPVMHELLYPFVIFYRFHSAMDMYGCYRKFQIQPQVIMQRYI